MEPHIPPNSYGESILVFICSVFLLLVLWQVETVAQFGVVFLLFALGLEFSMTKVDIQLRLTVT